MVDKPHLGISHVEKKKLGSASLQDVCGLLKTNPYSVNSLALRMFKNALFGWTNTSFSESRYRS